MPDMFLIALCVMKHKLCSSTLQWTSWLSHRFPGKEAEAQRGGGNAQATEPLSGSPGISTGMYLWFDNHWTNHDACQERKTGG